MPLDLASLLGCNHVSFEPLLRTLPLNRYTDCIAISPKAQMHHWALARHI